MRRYLLECHGPIAKNSHPRPIVFESIENAFSFIANHLIDDFDIEWDRVIIFTLPDIEGRCEPVWMCAGFDWENFDQYSDMLEQGALPGDDCSLYEVLVEEWSEEYPDRYELWIDDNYDPQMSLDDDLNNCEDCGQKYQIINNQIICPNCEEEGNGVPLDTLVGLPQELVPREGH